MAKDWLDELQAEERAERERYIQEAAARNRLISEEAPRIFERLLASFKAVAANCRVPGVGLRYDRPELDLGRVMVTVHRGVTPLRTEVNINLDRERQEIKCSSQVGGTQTYHFGVTFGAVTLYQEANRIPKLEAICETALKPLLSVAKALR